MKFDISKFDYNNADNIISVEQVCEYINLHDLAYDFVTVNNACNCDNAEFDIYKFYYALHDNLVDSELFDNYDDPVEKYDDNDNYDIYEIQIYFCPECKRWCIDYTNI